MTERKIRSPGERINNKEAVSCSVSSACSARLIKTIRAATANDKRPTWLLGFISTDDHQKVTETK